MCVGCFGGRHVLHRKNVDGCCWATGQSPGRFPCCSSTCSLLACAGGWVDDGVGQEWRAACFWAVWYCSGCSRAFVQENSSKCCPSDPRGRNCGSGELQRFLPPCASGEQKTGPAATSRSGRTPRLICGP